MNIVCGTDFSVHGNKAVLASAVLAARQGGTLSLVHGHARRAGSLNL